MKLEEKDLLYYFKIAKKAALLSGNLLRKNYKKFYKINEKGIRDVVTEIDKKSENFIKNYFKKYTPQINFYGEETGGNIENLSWVVDPLDGTKNYIHKIPYFGVSIALCLDLKPIIGIVYFPLLNKLYWAIEGKGAFLEVKSTFLNKIFCNFDFLNRISSRFDIFNKIKKLNISDTNNLSSSFLATGFPHSKSHLVSNYIVELEAILKNVSAVRRLGSAAFDLCSVAEGTFDAFWEYGLESWDVAAGALIAKEAKAFISNASGGNWDIKSDSILASNQNLKDQLLMLIKNSHK
ncbi:MAG TPA: inositol monophosphatase family protein [Exilispira sp.]|nr:inositol monophosphatase family protein [Exilispira sp.]